MFGPIKTRKDFQEETGLKGKALTEHLRMILAGGGYIRRLVYTEPGKSSKRLTVYQTVPKQIELMESGRE